MRGDDLTVEEVESLIDEGLVHVGGSLDDSERVFGQVQDDVRSGRDVFESINHRVNNARR